MFTSFKQKVTPLGVERLKVLQFFALIIRDKDSQLVEAITKGSILRDLIVLYHGKQYFKAFLILIENFLRISMEQYGINYC